MNFNHILSEIEKNDPDVYDKLSGRRDVLKGFGTKVALAALPFAIGSLFKKAYGKNTGVAVDALNLALEFEYLEYTYYQQGINTGLLIPSSDLAGFKAIAAQEAAHVTFLNTAIGALGGVPFKPNNFAHPTTVAPYVPAAYDFTMGGKYTPFSDYPTFLLLANVFEDAGIHGIAGQFAGLLDTNATLVQAMQIHAVEARHAAYVRLMRRLPPVNAAETPSPWISNNIPPSIPFQSYYNGEDNMAQNGMVISSLPNTNYTDGQTPKISASAAFDEPFDKARVLSFIKPFKV